MNEKKQLRSLADKIKERKQQRREEQCLLLGEEITIKDEKKAPVKSKMLTQEQLMIQQIN